MVGPEHDRLPIGLNSTLLITEGLEHMAKPDIGARQLRVQFNRFLIGLRSQLRLPR